MNLRRLTAVLMILTLTVLMTSCAAQKTADQTATQASGNTAQALGYRQITQEEAQQMMKSEKDYIILDVRTPEEFAEGHIPGAICISHDTITDAAVPELPDKAQLIMVYCRSGRRSKLAAEQLAKNGYTNIVEFGGIIDWTGEVIKD